MSTIERDIVPQTPPVSETPIAPHDPEAILTAKDRKQLYRARLKQTTNRPRLKAYLLHKREELKGRDLDSHARHLRDTDQMSRYLNGQQYGDYDENGIYQPYSRMPNETCYSIPVLNGHVDQALMMLLKTQIEYECNAKDQNSPSHKAVARVCEELGNEDAKRLMEEVAQYDEGLNSLVSGESYRLLIWGAHPEHPKKAIIPEYEDDQQYEVPAMKVCQACGYPQPPDAVECSECQATYLTDHPAHMETRPGAFKSNREVMLGENILHIPHMMAVKRDLSASQLRHSSYIIETDYLPSKEHAEWLYQCDIADTQGQMSEAMRLRQEQERATIQTVPEGSTWPDRNREVGPIGIERNHIWMEPSEYGPTTFEVDETLPDGSVLKAGTPMGDHYPGGFKYCTVGDTIVTAGKGDKKRQWTEVLYGKRPGSSRGAGLQTGIVLQDIINDCFNLGYATTQSSIPFRAVLRKFVQQLPPAGSVVMVDGIPPNGVAGAVHQYPAQTDSGAAGATAARIEESMQFILGTSTLLGKVGGAAGKGLGTATGIAAWQENANGRSLAPITQRVACDKEFRFQILENIKDFSSDHQKKQIADRFGPDVAEAFFECDFRNTVEWTTKKNTDKPRSDALTLSVMMEFGQVAANLAKSQAPWAMDMLSEMADLAGIPFNVAPGRTDRREAEARLNRLASIEQDMLAKDPGFLSKPDAAAQMFAALEKEFGPLSYDSSVKLAEMNGAEEPQVDGLLPFYFMQDHQSFLDVIHDALFSEEAKMWPVARKIVLINMWMEHFKAQTGATSLKAEFAAMLAAKLNPHAKPEDENPTKTSLSFKDAKAFPSVAAQLVEKAGMDPKGMYPDNDQQAQGADAANEAGLAVLDHKLGEAAADTELKRDLIREGHRAESQIAIDTNKARLAPKPPAGAAAKKTPETKK